MNIKKIIYGILIILIVFILILFLNKPKQIQFINEEVLISSSPIPILTTMNEIVEPKIIIDKYYDKKIYIDEPYSFKEDMQYIMNKVLAKYTFNDEVGVYIKELKTGMDYGINENLTKVYSDTHIEEGYFRAASIIKIYMAIVVIELIDKGELDVNQEYFDQIIGKSYNILDAMDIMIRISDNDAYNFFLRLIDKENIVKILNSYGVTYGNLYGELDPATNYSIQGNILRHNTEIIGGRITLKETSNLIEYIYNNKEKNIYVNLLHESLLNNIKTARIPTGIEMEYLVAHKTGTATNYGVFLDAGIIYCNNPYILIVFTKGEKKENAENFIRDVAKDITSYINLLDFSD